MSRDNAAILIVNNIDGKSTSPSLTATTASSSSSSGSNNNGYVMSAEERMWRVRWQAEADAKQSVIIAQAVAQALARERINMAADARAGLSLFQLHCLH
jgi:activator of HSP90 ATPase